MTACAPSPTSTPIDNRSPPTSPPGGCSSVTCETSRPSGENGRWTASGPRWPLRSKMVAPPIATKPISSAASQPRIAGSAPARSAARAIPPMAGPPALMSAIVMPGEDDRALADDQHDAPRVAPNSVAAARRVDHEGPFAVHAALVGLLTADDIDVLVGAVRVLVDARSRLVTQQERAGAGLLVAVQAMDLDTGKVGFEREVAAARARDQIGDHQCLIGHALPISPNRSDDRHSCPAMWRPMTPRSASAIGTS